jgi:ribonuclease BN (tRNA processing enzyme)
MITKNKYPIIWNKDDFSIKIFCSIPNIATGILLKAGSSHFIIDPGDGILRDLNKELGTKNILNISDIFVSHGHHDHVGGVWSILTYLRVMNKISPLTIYFPRGCVEIGSIYNAFRKVYSKTISYKINLMELNHTKTFKRKSVLIKPFPVLHKEYLRDGVKTRQVPAFGYKFIYRGKKICYGGDTAYCRELVSSAKNSDLAILEAGHNDATSDEMHMTIAEAKSIGKTAKKYFLVHVPE